MAGWSTLNSNFGWVYNIISLATAVNVTYKWNSARNPNHMSFRNLIRYIDFSHYAMYIVWQAYEYKSSFRN